MQDETFTLELNDDMLNTIVTEDPVSNTKKAKTKKIPKKKSEKPKKIKPKKDLVTDKKLKSPLKRALIGIVSLIIGSTIACVGYFMFSGDSVTIISPDKIDPQNNGNLVYLVGSLSTQKITEPLFKFTIDGLQLKRIVEVYQWNQIAQDKPYEKKWSSTLIPNTPTSQAKGWINPSTLLIDSLDTPPKIAKLTIGQYTIPEAMAKKLFEEKDYDISQEKYNALSKEAKDAFKLYQGKLYFGLDPTSPQIGDIKINFKLIGGSVVTILARQNGKALSPYNGSEGVYLEAKRGNIPLEDISGGKPVFEGIVPCFYFYGAGGTLALFGLILLLSALGPQGNKSKTQNANDDNPLTSTDSQVLDKNLVNENSGHMTFHTNTESPNFDKPAKNVGSKHIDDNYYSKNNDNPFEIPRPSADLKPAEPAKADKHPTPIPETLTLRQDDKGFSQSDNLMPAVTAPTNNSENFVRANKTNDLIEKINYNTPYVAPPESFAPLLTTKFEQNIHSTSIQAPASEKLSSVPFLPRLPDNFEPFYNKAPEVFPEGVDIIGPDMVIKDHAPSIEHIKPADNEQKNNAVAENSSDFNAFNNIPILDNNEPNILQHQQFDAPPHIGLESNVANEPEEPFLVADHSDFNTFNHIQLHDNHDDLPGHHQFDAPHMDDYLHNLHGADDNFLESDNYDHSKDSPSPKAKPVLSEAAPTILELSQPKDTDMSSHMQNFYNYMQAPPILEPEPEPKIEPEPQDSEMSKFYHGMDGLNHEPESNTNFTAMGFSTFAPNPDFMQRNDISMLAPLATEEKEEKEENNENPSENNTSENK